MLCFRPSPFLQPTRNLCTDFILFEPATELVILVVYLALEILHKHVVDVVFESTRVPEPLSVSAVRGCVGVRACALLYPRMGGGGDHPQ